VLDAKFLEGIYEAIPQILLQTYIMFLLSVSSGSFQFPIFFSLLISMLTVSGVLVMVVDRGKVRQITLGPRRKNPWFVRYLAHGIAVLFEGENLCTKNKFGLKSHEGMKELIHYSVPPLLLLLLSPPPPSRVTRTLIIVGQFYFISQHLLSGSLPSPGSSWLWGHTNLWCF
jgi:hypothetical protein